MSTSKTPGDEYMRAVAAQTDFKPCERTVRMCIEALPTVATHSAVTVEEACAVGAFSAQVHQALQSLLPDPAKALVEEFAGSGTATKVHVTDDGIRPFVDPLEFARWLIGTGRIRSRE